MKRRDGLKLIASLILVCLMMPLFLPLSPVQALLADTETNEYTLELSSETTYFRPNHPSVESEYTLPSEDDYAATEIAFYNSEEDGYAPNDSEPYSYATFSWTATAAGLHTFEIVADDWTASNLGDTMLWLYADSFTAATPLANVRLVNDDGGSYLYSKLSVDLAVGDTCIVVLTALPAILDGSATLSITSPIDSGSPDDGNPDDGNPDDGDPGDGDPGDGDPDPDPDTELKTGSHSNLPEKRDPITILHSATGVRTEDLSYFAAIPEQWMADVTYVEFWLDAAAVSDDPAQHTAVAQADAALRAAGRTLYETRLITLMSRVTWRDGDQDINPIPPAAIRANIPVLLPIPAGLIDITGLGIACIDASGAVAWIASERVTIAGIDYLRFENNNLPAMYGFVS